MFFLYLYIQQLDTRLDTQLHEPLYLYPTGMACPTALQFLSDCCTYYQELLYKIAIHFIFSFQNAVIEWCLWPKIVRNPVSYGEGLQLSRGSCYSKRRRSMYHSPYLADPLSFTYLHGTPHL